MRRQRESQAVFNAHQLDPRFKHGCVGHWISGIQGKGWTDRSGCGNHGTITGTQPALGFNGLRPALRVAAGTDLINCGSGSALDDLGAMTLAAWVYTTSLAAEQQIVSKINAGLTTGWVFTIGTTGKVAFFQFETGTNNFYETTPVVVVNNWTHIALTQTALGGTCTIYFNGVAQALGTNTGGASGVSDASNNLTIASREGDALGLVGVIDDVRVFNRTLSAAEVATLASPSFFPVLC